MNGLSISIKKSETRSFDRKTICYFKISPNCKPRAVLLILLKLKLTAEESEKFRPLRDQFWDCSNFEVV